jgi:phage anti-repressor protein
VRTPALAFAFLLAGGVAAGAQTAHVNVEPLSDDDIKLIRQDIQSQRESIIKDTMQFNETEAAAFWPVYKQYANEQRAIADKRFDLIIDYAHHIDTMTDEAAGKLTQRFFDIEDESQALRRKYFPKFESAIGAKRAAKFFQVDNRLTMIWNMQLAREIPLIP